MKSDDWFLAVLKIIRRYAYIPMVMLSMSALLGEDIWTIDWAVLAVPRGFVVWVAAIILAEARS